MLIFIILLFIIYINYCFWLNIEFTTYNEKKNVIWNIRIRFVGSSIFHQKFSFDRNNWIRSKSIKSKIGRDWSRSIGPKILPIEQHWQTHPTDHATKHADACRIRRQNGVSKVWRKKKKTNYNNNENGVSNTTHTHARVWSHTYFIALYVIRALVCVCRNQAHTNNVYRLLIFCFVSFRFFFSFSFFPRHRVLK